MEEEDEEDEEAAATPTLTLNAVGHLRSSSSLVSTSLVGTPLRSRMRLSSLEGSRAGSAASSAESDTWCWLESDGSFR